MTPRQAGFHMPAEWEPHYATWIAWPHNEHDWPGRFEPIPWVYAEIVRKIAAVERICILVSDEEIRLRASEILRKVGADLGCVNFYLVPTNRVWTRDFAPSFLISQTSTGAVKWRFNGWAKYDDWQHDD